MGQLKCAWNNTYFNSEYSPHMHELVPWGEIAIYCLCFPIVHFQTQTSGGWTKKFHFSNRSSVKIAQKILFCRFNYYANSKTANIKYKIHNINIAVAARENVQLRLSPRHAYLNVKIHQNINQTKTKSKDIKSNNKNNKKEAVTMHSQS